MLWRTVDADQRKLLLLRPIRMLNRQQIPNHTLLRSAEDLHLFVLAATASIEHHPIDTPDELFCDLSFDNVDESIALGEFRPAIMRHVEEVVVIAAQTDVVQHVEHALDVNP